MNMEHSESSEPAGSVSENVARLNDYRPRQRERCKPKSPAKLKPPGTPKIRPLRRVKALMSVLVTAMRDRRATKPPGLIEPVPIDDELCTGVMVEDLGFARRLVFYNAQTCYESESASPVHAVKRKIIIEPGALYVAVSAILISELSTFDRLGREG